MNMLLTPGHLMRALCHGWTVTRPEDKGLPIEYVLRKMLRSYAMEGGVSMVLMLGADGAVRHYALLNFPHFNG